MIYSRDRPSWSGTLDLLLFWSENSDIVISWSVLYHRDLSLTLHLTLVGLVIKTSASRAEDPGSNPACAGLFSGSSHTSDLKNSTPVSTLQGAWRYRVSAGTGRPGVSIMWPGEMESLVYNIYLSVAARTIVWADPSLRYTSMLLGR